jgi:hypothetical protein
MASPAVAQIGELLSSGVPINQLTDAAIRQAITRLSVEHTMEGPSVLTVGVLDPDYWLLRKSRSSRPQELGPAAGHCRWRPLRQRRARQDRRRRRYRLLRRRRMAS